MKTQEVPTSTELPSPPTLTASRAAYDTVRVAGAAYLTWLGATVLFTAVDVLELAFWHWAAAAPAAALGARLRRPSVRRRLEQLSGVAFLGFAANLLVEPRATAATPQRGYGAFAVTRR